MENALPTGWVASRRAGNGLASPTSSNSKWGGGVTLASAQKVEQLPNRFVSRRAGVPRVRHSERAAIAYSGMRIEFRTRMLSRAPELTSL